MTTPSDLQDLEDLLASKGWTWLQERYQREWGADALVQKLEAIHTPVGDAAVKQAKVEQALVSRTAVRGMLEMPAREVQRLRDVLREHAESEMAGQSRRGVGL